MEAVNTAVADTGSGEESENGAAGTPGTPTLGQVLLAVEELWPESLAEEWDEVGLVVGRPTATVTKVMFAVDPTLAAIEEAIEWGAELLVTHHPLLLKGVTSVAATSAKASPSIGSLSPVPGC
ncbi:putative GTP cyclohydrolase 1 type 2 [Arthrobacter sp. Hiyo8]|nr:putative GTP cyclohydrolase 1 type 2 [Arthrobacter sp. Hiyo8]